jgi:hypothetical protein
MGCELVFNFDLEDFSPSIHFGRVMGLFGKKPYALPEQVALTLAQICCHCFVQVVDDDGAGLERHEGNLSDSLFVRLVNQGAAGPKSTTPADRRFSTTT